MCVTLHQLTRKFAADQDSCPQSGKLSLLPPFLCFISLDKRSARFTLPLYTIRRVERLNSRAGVFALSLATWHGMRVVRPPFLSIFLLFPLLLTPDA